MVKVLGLSVRGYATIVLTIGLGMTGIVNLESTASGAAKNVHVGQSIWFVLGLGVMVVVGALDQQRLRRYSGLFYLLTVGLLIAVLLVGKEVNGSRRWLDFGFASLQPSELAKIAIIVALATWFNRVIRPDGYTMTDLVPVAVLLGVPMFLVLQEPDLGHTLMLFFIGGTMLVYEKFERRALVTLIAVGLIGVPLAWNFVLRDYQKDRVLTLLDAGGGRQGTGWHATQARVAVGSGGLRGKGQGRGTQVAGGFLPENHTDFVFAHLAEERGFVGATPALLLYFCLMIAALRIARSAASRFGGVIAVGVCALIFWHVLMNVGMVLNLLPVTGVTLPLLSYGGSSMLTVMAGMGLLINVDRNRLSRRSSLA
ncbi:MAG: rod shape-determining protein RodA [Myxococcota bacterium]|nr:rod shape-determining protein RodA [Myxococcota bacterium]